MPTIIGSTTVRANRAEIAASIALPPAASISAPAADASGWLVTTMPRLPVAGHFSQLNVVPARVRQSRSDIWQSSFVPNCCLSVDVTPVLRATGATDADDNPSACRPGPYLATDHSPPCRNAPFAS